MLGLVIAVFLAFAGYRTKRLEWLTYVYLAAGAAVAVVVQTSVVSQNRNARGEDGALLWEPAAIVGNFAFAFGLWAAVYTIGYLCGTWRRRRS